MATDPYDTNNFPGKFKTTYVGFAEGFYCLRLNMDVAPGLDALMWQGEVLNWLFDTLEGRWIMGNGFPYPDHPKINLVNYNSKDVFVLIERFDEILLFEERFQVTGVTPSTLA